MKSMLIIEGSQIVARLFAEMFERRGWNVVICNDRGCAFERLAENEPYDVILVSYRVHGTDGLQLIRLIRALDHLRLTPVVMVTGTGEIMKEALAAGADAVLIKPINPNALVSTVEKHTS
jgi:CheY-like chemotaxis protein